MSKEVSYELLEPLAISKDKNQLFHPADIMLADPCTVLHPTLQELGVKIEKKEVYG